MTTILGLLVLGTALVFLETVLVGGVWAVAGVACYGGAVWAANAEFGAGAALAPTGKVEIDGLPYDARCETAVAAAGEELVVSRATPFELIVVKI